MLKSFEINQNETADAESVETQEAPAGQGERIQAQVPHDISVLEAEPSVTKNLPSSACPYHVKRASKILIGARGK